MQAVFFADLHLNKQVDGRKHRSGYPQRVIDILNNLRLVIDFAIDNEVDYLLFGGDAYETGRPLEEYRHMFRSEIIRAAQKGIKCILIPGNHDMTKRDTADHALAEFRDLPSDNIYLVDSPTLLEFDDVNIYCLPWQYTPFEEENIDTNKFTICIAHCSILGAVFQSGQVITSLDKDFGVNIEFFEQFDLALIGHIHAPQVLSEEPYIGYPGSGEWLTWGEIGQFHGYFHWDGERIIHRKYNHRPRYDIYWDGVEELPNVDPEAMYRIHLKDTHANLARVHFEDAFELKLIQEITRVSRPEVLEIKEEENHTEILTRYLADEWNADIEEEWLRILEDVESNR